MRTNSRSLLFTTFELWCVGLAALALLIVGNARLFLERYDLISSSTVIRQQLSQKVGSGLGILDSFSITPGVVTFITWSTIGLVVFSVTQAFTRASRAIQYERKVSSNQYIHPQNFTRDRYWKRIVTDAVVSFILLALVVLSAVMYLLFVVPVSFAYVQRFLLQVSLPHTVDLLAGLFTAFVGTALLYWLIKLAVWHHHLSQR